MRAPQCKDPSSKARFHRISMAYTRLLTAHHQGEDDDDEEYELSASGNPQGAYAHDPNDVKAFMRMVMELVGMFNEGQMQQVGDGKYAFGVMLGDRGHMDDCSSDECDDNDIDDDEDDLEDDAMYAGTAAHASHAAATAAAAAAAGSSSQTAQAAQSERDAAEAEAKRRERNAKKRKKQKEKKLREQQKREEEAREKQAQVSATVCSMASTKPGTADPQLLFLLLCVVRFGCSVLRGTVANRRRQRSARRRTVRGSARRRRSGDLR